MSEDTSRFLFAIIFLPISLWVWQSGVLQTAYAPEFLAVLLLLSIATLGMLVEWLEASSQPTGSPEIAFNRLPSAAARIGLCIYLVVASYIKSPAPYLQILRQTAFNPFERWHSFVWGPLAMCALLLVSGIYSLIMGLRYVSVPPSMGKAVTWSLYVIAPVVLLYIKLATPYLNDPKIILYIDAIDLVAFWALISCIARNMIRLLLMTMLMRGANSAGLWPFRPGSKQPE